MKPPYKREGRGANTALMEVCRRLERRLAPNEFVIVCREQPDVKLKRSGWRTNMQLFLNAGFADPLGQANLDRFVEFGFVGVRRDVEEDNAQQYCAEFKNHVLRPLFLVGAGRQMARDGQPIRVEEIVSTAALVAKVSSDLGLFERELPAAIEIGNEPDIAVDYYSQDPGRFADAVCRSYERIKGVDPRAVVVCGGVSNVDRDSLEYLERVLASGLPDDVAIGYHCYHTTVPFGVAHSGFRTREEEFDALRRITGSKGRWCTEVGWHTAPSQRKGLFKKPIRFNDEQVAAFTAAEIDLHASQGDEVFAVFQHQDGPGEHYEHKHGIFCVDGTPKLVAFAIKERAATLTPPRAA